MFLPLTENWSLHLLYTLNYKQRYLPAAMRSCSKSPVYKQNFFAIIVERRYSSPII